MPAALGRLARWAQGAHRLAICGATPVLIVDCFPHQPLVALRIARFSIAESY